MTVCAVYGSLFLCGNNIVSKKWWKVLKGNILENPGEDTTTKPENKLKEFIAQLVRWLNEEDGEPLSGV